jgi:phospholipid/cholesterol/gamma-HCH transport system substrate-binding protein
VSDEKSTPSRSEAGAAGRAAKVGALVLAAVVVLAVGVFLIGRENNLFSRKNHYYVDLGTVSGIKPGNPVDLDGVTVGAVNRVILPRDPAKKFIRVWMTVDRRYERRVRADSLVRVKTLGLLGDKYLEFNSGSPATPKVEDEGALQAAPATGVDALIASSADVMDNISIISFELKKILTRVNRGEGLLGELTSDSPANRRLKQQVFDSMDAIQRVAEKLDNGSGPLPRLLNDKALADRLASSIDSLHAVLASAQNGPGLVPGLLNDPKTRSDYDQTIGSLQKVAANLQKFSTDLDQGQGLLPRLVHDEAYGRQVTGEVQEIVERLDEVSKKLAGGEGTVGKLIDDPHVYDSINDVLIGIDDSWMLRWLVRNRQKAGIKHRYHDAQETPRKDGGPEPALEPAPIPKPTPAPASPSGAESSATPAAGAPLPDAVGTEPPPSAPPT